MYTAQEKLIRLLGFYDFILKMIFLGDKDQMHEYENAVYKIL